MQNEETLTNLGFRKIPSGEWLLRGKNQKFTAHVITNNGPVYVSLLMVSPEIDNRPLSENYGKHFRSKAKDCCSAGSVERALALYDLPEQEITRVIGGILIKDISE